MFIKMKGKECCYDEKIFCQEICCKECQIYLNLVEEQDEAVA